jgi:hypothetical protein
MTEAKRRDAVRERRYSLDLALRSATRAAALTTEISSLETRLESLRSAARAASKNAVAYAIRAVKARRRAERLGTLDFAGTSPLVDALESAALLALPTPPRRSHWTRERRDVLRVMGAGVEAERKRRGKR